MPKQKQDLKNQMHQPVLLSSVLEYLNPKAGESYLDLTAGYGGHATEVLKHTKAPDKAVLVDRDQEAVDYLKQNLKKAGVHIMHADFYEAATKLLDQQKSFDLILADLGLSSLHLEKPSRGFSFQTTGPLDMRMDQTQDLTAFNVVNDWDEKDLESIFRWYGEEPKAEKIAKAILNTRPIDSTSQLATLVSNVLRSKKTKIHPATKVFQAIRLAVNNELELIKKTLPLTIRLLNPNGRIVVISFHSLEDREVKQLFKTKAEGKYTAEIKLLTKHPIVPTHQEIVINPRARSAKLRAAVKIKIKEGAHSAYSGKK